MPEKIHRYPLQIKEIDLDVYAHVNNTTYLTFFEEARWDFINSNGYGYSKIMETGFGPIVLETTIRYLKELRLRDVITIETSVTSYEKKIGKILQKMVRDNEICCTAEFTIALFDLKERKIVLPSPDWRKAMELED